MGLGEGSSKESLSGPIPVDLKTVVSVGDGRVPGETSVPLSVGWCHCQVLKAEEKSPVRMKRSLLLGAPTPTPIDVSSFMENVDIKEKVKQGCRKPAQQRRSEVGAEGVWRGRGHCCPSSPVETLEQVFSLLGKWRGAGTAERAGKGLQARTATAAQRQREKARDINRGTGKARRFETAINIQGLGFVWT